VDVGVVDVKNDDGANVVVEHIVALYRMLGSELVEEEAEFEFVYLTEGAGSYVMVIVCAGGVV
jgi:hypothetical protein